MWMRICTIVRLAHSTLLLVLLGLIDLLICVLSLVLVGSSATLAVLLVVCTLIGGALSPRLVMLSMVSLLHVLLLLVGPSMLILDFIAQIVILTVLGPVAALLIGIIVFLFAFFLTLFFVDFQAHVLLFSILLLLHRLLLLMLLLFLGALMLGGSRFGVLALLQIDQIVHSHHRLLAKAMLRILLLILAFVLLRAHSLVYIVGLTIVVPGWRILLSVHIV